MKEQFYSRHNFKQIGLILSINFKNCFYHPCIVTSREAELLTPPPIGTDVVRTASKDEKSAGKRT